MTLWSRLVDESPAAMASLALRRLQKEFSDFPRDNPNLQLFEDDDIQDLTRWKVKFVGAKDTIYEGEEFCLQVQSSIETVLRRCSLLLPWTIQLRAQK